MDAQRPKLNTAVFVILLFFFILPAFIYYAYILAEQQRWDDLQLLKTATQPHRGTPTERDFVLKLLKSGFHPKAIFHDLYIKKKDGTYTQIDLVLATKVGLIVIEIKDYAGWIYGNGSKKYWTQVLSYGRVKNSFYNPVMQNEKHIKHLSKALPKERVPIFNMIIFYGDSQFRDISEIPHGVVFVKHYNALNAVNHIVNYSTPAKYTDKHEVMRVLSEAVANGDDMNIVYAHANYVNSIKTNNAA